MTGIAELRPRQRQKRVSRGATMNFLILFCKSTCNANGTVAAFSLGEKVRGPVQQEAANYFTDILQEGINDIGCGS